MEKTTTGEWRRKKGQGRMKEIWTWKEERDEGRKEEQGGRGEAWKLWDKRFIKCKRFRFDRKLRESDQKDDAGWSNEGVKGDEEK